MSRIILIVPAFLMFSLSCVGLGTRTVTSFQYLGSVSLDSENFILIYAHITETRDRYGVRSSVTRHEGHLCTQHGCHSRVPIAPYSGSLSTPPRQDTPSPNWREWCASKEGECLADDGSVPRSPVCDIFSFRCVSGGQQ